MMEAFSPSIVAVSSSYTLPVILYRDAVTFAKLISISLSETVALNSIYMLSPEGNGPE